MILTDEDLSNSCFMYHHLQSYITHSELLPVIPWDYYMHPRGLLNSPYSRLIPNEMAGKIQFLASS